jgi:hypothetical protein
MDMISLIRCHSVCNVIQNVDALLARDENSFGIFRIFENCFRFFAIRFTGYGNFRKRNR